MEEKIKIYDKLSMYRDNVVVILGLGKMTKHIIDILNYHKIQIDFICDNNKNNWGKTYENLPVISPSQLTDLVTKSKSKSPNEDNKDFVVQISVDNIDENVKGQLLSIGVKAVFSFEQAFVGLDFVGGLNLTRINSTIIDEYKKNHTLDSITFAQLMAKSNEVLKNNIEYSNQTILEYYNLLKLATKLLNQATNLPKSTLYRFEFCLLLEKFSDVIIDKGITIKRQPEINVFSPNTYTDGTPNRLNVWGNVNLMKDCGLVGYTLAEAIGAKPYMFFCSRDKEYSYAELLPNLELVYHDIDVESIAKVYVEYLKENYEKIDVLVLYGVYELGLLFLNEYRKLRPDGKVYCSLDMNSGWMSRIYWDSPKIKNFANQCDFIGTTCTSLCRALNLNPKVNFTCRFISNGFYNASNTPIVCDAKNKENIIITVGRIGTQQKNNQELMIAFANIADRIPTWTLRLVGPVDEGFETFIKNYFDKHPNLKDRVIVTGAIVDKTALYNEYAKAKIFALTSVVEGFPNVYAEALVHGCKFITSDIDAADDIINYGELGVKYELGNIGELCSKLLSMCTDESDLQEHIQKCKVYAEHYFDWNRSAKKIAIDLFN